MSSSSGLCPQCGRELVVKHVGQRSFLGCSGYPDCEYTQGLREQSEIEPQPLGVPCPDCGSELQIKSGRYGLFVGCSNYPNCTFVAEADDDAEQQIACPECHKGKLIGKTSRRGTRFFACDQYPQCQYSLNYPPVNQACPKCQWPVLVEKRRNGVRYLQCPQKSCGYKQESV
ncbi:hypothetical protein CWI84_02740 [Idiomarina tyrosinivorans]|uniref:DNA topoisomerase type IA zn finger domain-containing protein n=1 Tax=Idiomarina tyrosinivorans TaxID=1445662 RepID=A0A432ZSY2_9GAMM|nr:type I DNA topoisomerase [Idiomarina tyrosinivorans]RUO81045.1 hypothetical protein CWI84_02740 [Idiomarina tyrosinivorans]